MFGNSSTDEESVEHVDGIMQADVPTTDLKYEFLFLSSLSNVVLILVLRCQPLTLGLLDTT